MAAETELEIGRQRLIILLSRNHLRGPLLKMIWSIFHGCRHKKLFLFTFQTLPGKYDKSSLKVWDSGLSYNHKTQLLMQFFVSIFKMKCNINLQSSLRNFVTKIIISCLKLKLHLRYGYLETPISIHNNWLQ